MPAVRRVLLKRLPHPLREEASISALDTDARGDQIDRQIDRERELVRDRQTNIEEL